MNFTLGRDLASRPIFSESFINDSEKLLIENCIYIYMVTTEERTNIVNSQVEYSNITQVQVIEESENSFSADFQDTTISISLIQGNEVQNFLKLLDHNLDIYLDITGLSHHVWAILIKEALLLNLKIKVMYNEPFTYNPDSNKSQIYTLSTNISPIKPIPGFTVLRTIGVSNFLFIPLLGFEKRRFELMFNSVDPPRNATFPVIGVPGFKISFTFETYFSNRKKLKEDGLWRNTKYSAANCPFRLFYTLYDISNEKNSELYKIALIGTKPHALGAVLFYLMSGLTVELLYDHPTRKPGRSSGAHKLHIYHIDLFKKFLEDKKFVENG
jgi:hypothetical protein